MNGAFPSPAHRERGRGEGCSPLPHAWGGVGCGGQYRLPEPAATTATATSPTTAAAEPAATTAAGWGERGRGGVEEGAEADARRGEGCHRAVAGALHAR